MGMNTNHRYEVLRVGEDTKSTVQGQTYIVVYGNRGWEAWDSGEVVYQAGQTAFLNTKFWEILDDYDEEVPYKNTNPIDELAEMPKEIKMSFDKVQQEEMVIEMGVIMVNGSRLDKFSDEAIIGMVKAERAKLLTLIADVGAGSKYYQAKKVGMEANVAILLDALDSRVDS